MLRQPSTLAPSAHPRGAFLSYRNEVSYTIKKNPAKQDSPPAAGRASDILPFRCSAIHAERLLSYGNEVSYTIIRMCQGASSQRVFISWDAFSYEINNRMLALRAFYCHEQLPPATENQHPLLPGASFYPSATSSTIISTNPTANPTVPRFECSPSEASGISSSTTT